jgi:nucleoside-diphosphate-sugar epimerase
MKGYDSVITLVGTVRGAAKYLMAVNAELPMHLATEAARAGVSRFIALSSFSVYGAASHIGPGTPLHPTTAYGRSRLAGERKIAQLAERMHCTIARCPLLYGMGDSKLEKLISLWCRLGIIPTSSMPVNRSMAHYNLAARYLDDVVQSPLSDCGLTVDHFADPLAFEYRRAAEILSIETGVRKRTAPLPPFGLKLLASISPGMFRSLYSDSLLEPSKNHFCDPSHTRLYQDIARMARGQGNNV